MRFYRLGLCVCLSTFAVAACAGTALNVGISQDANTSPSPATTNSPSNQNDKSDQAVFSLDLQNPEITQKIGPDDGDPEQARFIKVELIEITNPQKHPTRFEIRYQLNEGEKILLGSFSLYPPDNPGKFIVPTQGKVKADGKLILTMISEGVSDDDVVKATVTPMKFVDR